MKHPGLVNSLIDNKEDFFDWSKDNFVKAKK